MHRSSWKRAEREFAADLGGRRIPVTGERAGADVEHDRFHLQVKVRGKLPSWIFAWLDGIVTSARAKSRIGVLVMRRPRGLRKDALVVLRWEDFAALNDAIDQAKTERDELAKSWHAYRNNIEREIAK